MIKLHHGREGERPVRVNADLIETVEATPDTVVTLTDAAASCSCTETPDEIVALVVGVQAAVASRPHVLTGG